MQNIITPVKVNYGFLYFRVREELRINITFVRLWGGGSNGYLQNKNKNKKLENNA